MSDKLTDEQLREIEARRNSVTTAPWQWHWNSGEISIVIQNIYAAGDLRRAKDAPSVVHVGVAEITQSQIMDENNYLSAHQQYESDANFIAHAPTDITALLASHAALQARVTVLEAAAEAARIKRMQSQDMDTMRGDEE